MDVEKLRSELARFGQQHLLAFWPALSDDEKTRLYEDVASIDLDEMTDLYRKSTNPPDEGCLDDRMRPIEAELCGSVNRASPEEIAKYESRALEAIARGEVGVLLLAGGQGTRLGVPYPKGMYRIGLPSDKTLYQVQLERILRLEARAAKQNGGKSGSIVMYIMTSEHTQGPTIDFLDKHDYFGMKKENVVLFEQRMIPCFDTDGKIILAEKSKVARAPDGNGGLYWALKHEGVLEHMKARGIKHLHAYCVDNVLVKVADPVFMGYCMEKQAAAGNKVTEKTDPNEAVGVVCKVDGKYQVVEYSEISQRTAEMKGQDGRLVYNAGNICNHYFTLDFLYLIADKYLKALPHHVAKKKIPFVDGEGNDVKPTKANGIKLEKFVFDVFQFTDSFVVWECRRDHEFSPLKNADGAAAGTPTTAREALFALHKHYIEKAGALVNGKGGVEISPLLSYAGENLQSFKGQALVTPIVLEKTA